MLGNPRRSPVLGRSSDSPCDRDRLPSTAASRRGRCCRQRQTRKTTVTTRQRSSRSERAFSPCHSMPCPHKTRAAGELPAARLLVVSRARSNASSDDSIVEDLGAARRIEAEVLLAADFGDAELGAAVLGAALF